MMAAICIRPLRPRWRAIRSRRGRVRVELYRRFGYFPTESSEHAAEYVPWFLDHDDQIDRFRIPIDEYVHRSEANLRYYERTKEKLAAGEGFSLDRSVEYAVEIIHALETGDAASSTATSRTTN